MRTALRVWLIPTTALTLDFLFSKRGLRGCSLHRPTLGSREEETGGGRIHLLFLIVCTNPITTVLKSKGIWRHVQLLRRTSRKMRHATFLMASEVSLFGLGVFDSTSPTSVSACLFNSSGKRQALAHDPPEHLLI